MNRIGIVFAVCLLAALVAFAWLHNRTMVAGLPPREVCADVADAEIRAGKWARANGGIAVPVLGTGSMAPFIPPAPSAPMTTYAAYAVVIAGSNFADIKPGDLCVYRAEWDLRLSVIHQAAQKDSGGWIMSGLHNARSEAAWRVTPANFIGVTIKVFVW